MNVADYPDVVEEDGVRWRAKGTDIPCLEISITDMPRNPHVAPVTYLYPCWPVVIEGYWDFDLVMHKSLDSSDDWVVAERSTGFMVCDDEDRAGAYAIAVRRLAMKSPDELREAMEKARAKLAALAK